MKNHAKDVNITFNKEAFWGFDKWNAFGWIVTYQVSNYIT